MAKQRPIMIGCPQHQRLVGGSYECDEAGEYLLGADGSFVLDRARCNHCGGRCMQTLCVLHRHSRRGPKSWFPSQVLSAPLRRRQGDTGASTNRSDGVSSDGDLDILC